MNVGLSIHRNAVRTPKAPAIFGSGAKNYEELDVKSNQIAHFLERYGLKKGDRVALLVANRQEVVEVMHLRIICR